MKEKKILSFHLFRSSLLTAFKFLRKRAKYTHAHLSIILLLLILRSVTDFRVNQLKSKLNEYSANYDNALISFIIMRFWWISIEYVYKMVFEVLMAPIGGIISGYITKRILCSENQKALALPPQETEYIISEGSKSLAKIIRFIFITIMDAAIKISINYYYCYCNDKSLYKYVTSIFMILISIMMVARLRYLYHGFVLIFQASGANCLKEKHYTETIDSLPVVTAYNEGSKHIDRYENSAMVWEKVLTESKLVSLTSNIAFQISCELLTTLGTVLYISLLDSQNPSKTGMDANIDKTRAFNSVLMRIPLCFVDVAKVYNDLLDSVTLSQRLILLLKYVEEDISQKIRIDAFNDNITVQGLTYAIDDKVIFSNIALTINKGDRCAMVGRNGTGKSSIFKLLLGFDDYKGSITLDGIDIQRICMSDYRSLISYVPQDTKLFDESIYYNLAFGNNRPYKDIMEECKKMKIHEIIMRFPQGYNTVIEGGGKNINGGLRQKIFYTRAFLCNTEIYLFDKPTNNLDETSTSFILEYMSDARFSDKTFFVICHDPEIVEKFPKVFKLNERQIELERELC